MRDFFIGSVADPKEDYFEENFERCKEHHAHVMHKDTKCKGPFDSVKPNDVYFLKYGNNLLAYGEVLETKKLEEEGIDIDNGWTWLVIVKEWYFFDDSDIYNGVSNYGVSEYQIGGTNYDTIKEVNSDYGIKKLKEFNKKNPNTLCNKIIIEFEMDKIIKLLKNNHNLILTGAPGTGKTYLAKQIAKAMGCSDDEIGFVQFHPSYDYTDFVEGLRPNDDNNQVGFERKDGVFKEFCKKALKINDIDSAIEWFKNEIKNRGGSITIDKTNRGSSVNYQIKNSPNDSDNFMVLTNTNSCPPTGYPASIKDIKSYMATGNYDKNHDTYQPTIGEYIKTHFLNKPFVFIIDEINRGEISKIFGELFFSIDPGYRGEKGKTNTQYQNLIPKEGDSNYSLEKADVFRYGFYVPENVYIIGTMNDIDRSVESMDFAFRRRFAFKEIKADKNIGMLDELGGLKDKAEKKMSALNKAISDISGLNSAYHIGGAYFLKLKNYGNDFNELWDNHLDGLLREYLRGRRQDEIEKEMKNLKQAYDSAN